MAVDYKALGFDPDKADFKSLVSEHFGDYAMGWDAFKSARWKVGDHIYDFGNYQDLVKGGGFRHPGDQSAAWRKLYEDLDQATGRSARIGAERDARSTPNTPDPNDETTSIAPPDTFAPFIREMQRRMTDRSLLGTSGRDRMFAGRAFSPQLSIRERVPLPPPNPIRDYMVSRGIQNTQSPALGQQGSSLQKKPINSGGKKTLGGFLGGGLG